MQFIDYFHGYGTVANEFFRTDDGGRSWVKTKIPDIGFIDCLAFLAPYKGWIAGTHGSDFLVFQTVNGGRDWKESRITPPQPPERVRDLFFFDQQRGWLTIWNHIGEGTSLSALYSTVDGGEHWAPDPDSSFQGKDKMATVVRVTSRERGFVFFGEGRLAYTTDGGTHWHNQTLPRSVGHCQVFAGDLMCSAGPGFRLLTLHPK